MYIYIYIFIYIFINIYVYMYIYMYTILRESSAVKVETSIRSVKTPNVGERAGGEQRFWMVKAPK